MNILIKLREIKNLTENEKIVAKFLFENYMNIKKFKGEDISKETYTSLSTLTRLCKKLGFNGYKDFKLSLIEEISYKKNDNFEFENSDIDKNNDTQTIIYKLNNLSIESLKETKLLQDPDIIDKVVSMIDQKKIIDFYGVGASHIVCLDAQYKFMRVGKIAITFDSWDKQYIQAKNSTDEHIAIIISYSGKTEEMIKISKILKEKNIKSISITKYSNNEVSKNCDLNLYVTSKEGLKRSAAVYSRISMLNLIDVIYFKYSNINFEDVKKKIITTEIKK